MGKEAGSGNVATMGVHHLEDSACLLWVVTAHGVCLLHLFEGLVLAYLVPPPFFAQSAARNSKGELVFRAFARCFRGDTKWARNGHGI